MSELDPMDKWNDCLFCPRMTKNHNSVCMDCSPAYAAGRLAGLEEAASICANRSAKHIRGDDYAKEIRKLITE